MAYTRRRSFSSRSMRSTGRTSRSAGRPARRSYASRRSGYSARSRDVRIVIEQPAAQPAVTMETLKQGPLAVASRSTRSMF